MASRSRTPPRRFVSWSGLEDLARLLEDTTTTIPRPTRRTTPIEGGHAHAQTTTEKDHDHAHTTTHEEDHAAKTTTAEDHDHANTTTNEEDPRRPAGNAYYLPNRIKLNDIRFRLKTHLVDPVTCEGRFE